MPSDRAAAGAVVMGGGYSGTMVAAELARRGVSSVLVDGSGRAGRGKAFSTRDGAHLLNVPAGKMGAWADKPADFAEAFAAEGYEPEAFVPRRRYGEYLSATDHSFALPANCTGPLGSISESSDSLLNSLFEQELAKPDSLDLDVDTASRIAGAERAWAVGPMTKGKYWEITAVPDIRGQVARAAEDITEELRHAVQF